MSFQLTSSTIHDENKGEKISAVVWTTTPWTIPANLALCVNEKMKYALLRHSERNELLLVAEDLVKDFSTHMEGSLERISSLSGSDLVGLKAVHPLRGSEVPIISGDHVTSEAGTGIVHTAPAHGADDFNVYVRFKTREREKLFLQIKTNSNRYATNVIDRPRDQLTEEDVMGNLVSDKGLFTKYAGPALEGQNVLMEGTSTVVEMLRDQGSLLAVDANYIHRYPYDWRTKEPVIVRAMDQWFTSLDSGGLVARADKALDSVRTIPEIGKSRLRSVVKSRAEWCISRQRSWGVPIPAWYDIESEKTILTPETTEHFASIVEKHPRGMCEKKRHTPLLTYSPVTQYDSIIYNFTLSYKRYGRVVRTLQRGAFTRFDEITSS